MKINNTQKGYMPERVNSFLYYYRRSYTQANKEEDLRVLAIHIEQTDFFPLSCAVVKMINKRLQKYEDQ